jgi:hypothetical protein
LEVLAPNPVKPVEVDVFDGCLDLVVAVLPGSPPGLAGKHPIGSPVAGSGEAGTIDKGFDQADGMSVTLLPVVVQTPGDSRKNVAGEMWDFDPWKDQEPAIVRCQGQIGFALCRRPANEFVAGGRSPRGGTEQ